MKFCGKLLNLVKYGLISISLSTSVHASAQSNILPHNKSSSIVRNITLEKADNFRDLAGMNDGYQTESGQSLKTGVIYRSNALQLTQAEIEKIKGLNVSRIYDLRTPGEIKTHPDSNIPGVKWENRNLLGWEDIASVRTGFTVTPEQTIAGAEDIYRLLSNNNHSRQEIGNLITEIANNKSPQIIHCSGGKDRTGWVSAIMLHIAGVPRDVIVQDFMLSNDYSLNSIMTSFNNIAQTKGVEAALAFSPFLGVQENWLEISFNEAEKSFGSMDAYITKGLGISPKTQDKLRSKLLY